MAVDDDHARALAALAAACEEAVRRYGADWPRIRAAIDAYLTGLDPAERHGLMQGIDAPASLSARDRLH